MQVPNVGLLSCTVREDGIVMENVLIGSQELFLLVTLASFDPAVVVWVQRGTLLGWHLPHLAFIVVAC